jgi:NAD dependent epimerase/dehydratase family enzyme
MPAPAFALKLALGEMADLTLLGGQRAVPQRLQSLGYRFQFRELEPALGNLYGSR